MLKFQILTILYPANHYVNAKSSKESLFKLTYGGYKGNARTEFHTDSVQHHEGVRKSTFDPTGLDPTPDQAVTTIKVAGSNAEEGIIAVGRGTRGIQNRTSVPSGSTNRKR